MCVHTQRTQLWCRYGGHVCIQTQWTHLRPRCGPCLYTHSGLIHVLGMEVMCVYTCIMDSSMSSVCRSCVYNTTDVLNLRGLWCVHTYSHACHVLGLVALGVRTYCGLIYVLSMAVTHVQRGSLGCAAVRCRTRDRKVAGSTPGRGTIKSTRSAQPSISLG